MVTIVAEGDRKYRLEDAGGAALGWIRGNSVGFCGMASEEAAIGAAVAARRALEAVLQRQYAEWLRYEPSAERLHFVHDGAYEWIADGVVPIARLHRPFSAASPDESFAIELVLPSFATEHVTLAAVRAMARALRQLVPDETVTQTRSFS